MLTPNFVDQSIPLLSSKYVKGWLQARLGLQSRCAVNAIMQQLVNTGQLDWSTAVLTLSKKSDLPEEDAVLLVAPIPSPMDPCKSAEILIDMFESCLLRSNNLAVNEFALKLLATRFSVQVMQAVPDMIKPSQKSSRYMKSYVSIHEHDK